MVMEEEDIQTLHGSDALGRVPSSGLEPPRLSAQALNLLRIPFRHEGKSSMLRGIYYTYPGCLSTVED
jgi:hypothetical protein